LGYRVLTATVTITMEQVITQNLRLVPGPKVLLVIAARDIPKARLVIIRNHSTL
jgi:hypothetical protein